MKKMKEILKELIKRLNENDIIFGEVKLTKLFYLLEIDYFRKKRERLTNLKWIYYKYGPYSFELSNLLKKYPFIKDEYTYDLGKSFHKFSSDDLSETNIDEFIKALIFKVVKRWGIEDTNELLDYVYFETEPMTVVNKGAVLDFNTIKPIEPQIYKKIKLDKKVIEILHKKIEEKKQEFITKRNIKENNQ